MTAKVLREKYHFTLQKTSLEDSNIRNVEKRAIACILRMYIHTWSATFGFGANAGVMLHAICGKMNHSCGPNAMLLCLLNDEKDATVHCVALQNIEAGEEIRIDYTMNTQLSAYQSRKAAFQGNETMQFVCDCKRCEVEKGDPYFFSIQELFQLFEKLSNAEKQMMKTLLSKPAAEIKLGYFKLYLQFQQKFRPEKQEYYQKHLRCAMDFDVLIIERLSRLCILDTATPNLLPQMMNAFDVLPHVFWQYIERDVRFAMRLTAVILACYSEQLIAMDVTTYQKYVIQWALRQLLSFMQFSNFMKCFVDQCSQLPELRPAILSLTSVITVICDKEKLQPTNQM